MQAKAKATVKQITLQRGDRVSLDRGDGTRVTRVVSAPPARVDEQWAVWLEGVKGPVPLELCRPEGGRVKTHR